ncbi:DUF6504 family protein [Raineyella sp. LH-20]|uniref:DUF6504 family protein n=1 Tax=Raineyella sp. LH-20 TaxID=3081204 RepID=UPI002952AC58|nr:DUF6504 family protein [Raineyella sp. LH-20]WOP17637.1 DUF6504 family protein [Raineyella sp. LH-20]
MRKYDEPIEACFGAGSFSTLEVELPGLPAEFRWRSHTWRIREVEGHWALADPWQEWGRVGVLAEHCDVWQVRARDPWREREGVFQIYRHHASGRWSLLAVVD